MKINIELPEKYEEIPVDLVRANYDNLYEKGGIYFIYGRDDKLLYIGQSKNLYSRLVDHEFGRGSSERFSADISLFHVYFIGDPYLREIAETYAIHTYKPAYNTSKVFVKNKSEAQIEAEDMIYELRDERAQLVSENIRLQEDFGDFIAYEASDLSADGLEDWGTILHNRQRIAEIDEEIAKLRKVK